MFASLENSPAEQRAIEALIIETFDATLVEPGSLRRPEKSGADVRAKPTSYPGSASAAPSGRGLAPRGDNEDKPPLPEEPARPNWDQRGLWDAA